MTATMPMPMLADFAIRLACGLAAGLLLTPWRIKERNSARVAWRRKTPSIALVTNVLPGLRTPRIVMQLWLAWITTPTPLASSLSISSSATCWVSRSCNCGCLDRLSTTRGIFESPTTFPRGM